MASVAEYGGRVPIEFSTGELTGALGDSITVLPILVALGALTPLPLPQALALFGVFQIVWGVRYGIPISVEPMKALAGLAIAGAIGYGELLAAGLLTGAVLLVAGRTGLLTRLARFVGDPAVRGVQFAVALVLASSGVELAFAGPKLAAIAVVVTLLAVAVGYREVAALVVLGLGAAVALRSTGLPSPTLPGLALFPAGMPRLSVDVLQGTAAQLAMTVGNAAVATALLCSDLFDADVSPDELATSMGAMSLVSVPLGGLPMCHGSGGLAGKHAFGARTAGANVVLGGLYLAAALVAGVVAAFPIAVLGVLLVIVAIQLGRSAATTDAPLLTLGVGLLGLLVNVGVAFVVAVGVSALRRRWGTA